MYVAKERRAYILRLLQQQGSLHSATLARELGVTDETIRTDLVAMQNQGLLKRTHGGAEYILPLNGSDSSERPDCQLVQHALRFIEEGMRVYLDADTLTLVLVSQLAGLRCTLITPSLKILSQLSAPSLPQQIICPGGELDKESGIFHNEAARESLRNELRPDVCILCPPAVRSDVAAYNSPIRAAWARTAAESAAKTIIITPSAALSTHAPHAFPLPPGNTLITEDNLPPRFGHPDTVLIPYIAAEDLIQPDSFDY